MLTLVGLFTQKSNFVDKSVVDNVLFTSMDTSTVY